MLFDVRTYTCKPGMIKRHLALYQQMGLGPQTRHLGQPFAYLTTETGNEDFVVFSEEVQATIHGHESGNLLGVLSEEDSHTLSNGGVGLFGFHTNFFDNNSFSHTAAFEGILVI